MGLIEEIIQRETRSIDLQLWGDATRHVETMAA